MIFLSEEIPRNMGFMGIPGRRRYKVGYEMGTVRSNNVMKKDQTKACFGKISVDLCAGTHVIFIYTNINEYQYVGDTKAPLLRVIDSKQRLNNVSVCELEPTHRIGFFSNLDYQKNVIKYYTINFYTASH